MANPPLKGQSTVASIAGVTGENTAANGRGIAGIAKDGLGVRGELSDGTNTLGFLGGKDPEFGVHAGVYGQSSQWAVIGLTTSFSGIGVYGGGTGSGADGPGAGVYGKSKAGFGVAGESETSNGVIGVSHQGDIGVHGINNGNGWGAAGNNTNSGSSGFLGGQDPQFNQSAGVYGESRQQGVMGLTTVPEGKGVYGGGTTNAGGKQIGVMGETGTGVGVWGNSTGSGAGVRGLSQNGAGVLGQSEAANGVLATSKNGQGVTAFSDNDVGLFAQGGTWAGVFKGGLVVGKGPDPKNPNIQRNQINGSIVINDGGSLFLNGGGDIILANADCAEDFDLSAAADADPGCVMVLDGNGTLRQCAIAYDKHVVGVLSGAGDYWPGLVLDRHSELKGRVPLALMGKVYCKVDASYAPVEVGDLMTTSPTPGHAMKANDQIKAFGAVIGKALRPLTEGQGLIPILIALQ